MAVIVFNYYWTLFPNSFAYNHNRKRGLIDVVLTSFYNTQVPNAQQLRMRIDSEQGADYAKTSVNLPRTLRDALKAAGKANGRTMNAEIVARIIESEDRATFRQLIKQNDELRALMREMLDRLDLLK